jgi:hypothetical protein
MLTQARLAIRLNRFALFVVGAIVIVASLAALIVAAALRAAATPECLASRWDSSATVACQAQLTNFDQIDGTWGGIAPIGGLLVGVSLVAREIEERTAAIAWSLAPSRTRWLVGRVAPVAVILLVLFAIAAIAATDVEGAANPSVNPLLSFYNESSRGLELVALGFMVFCAAVLVGSVMGRVLPALLVAAVLGLALTVGAFVAESNWIQTQAVMVDARDGSNADGSLVLDQLLRLPSGELVPTWSVQWDEDANGNFIGPLAGATLENKVVPGSRHPFVEAVDAAGITAVSAVLLVLTGIVVRRRRPT